MFGQESVRCSSQRLGQNFKLHSCWQRLKKIILVFSLKQKVCFYFIICCLMTCCVFQALCVFISDSPLPAALQTPTPPHTADHNPTPHSRPHFQRKFGPQLQSILRTDFMCSGTRSCSLSPLGSIWTKQLQCKLWLYKSFRKLQVLESVIKEWMPGQPEYFQLNDESQMDWETWTRLRRT